MTNNPANEREGAPGWAWSLLIIFVILFLVIGIPFTCKKKENKKDNSNVSDQPASKIPPYEYEDTYTLSIGEPAILIKVKPHYSFTISDPGKTFKFQSSQQDTTVIWGGGSGYKDATNFITHFSLSADKEPVVVTVYFTKNL